MRLTIASKFVRLLLMAMVALVPTVYCRHEGDSTMAVSAQEPGAKAQKLPQATFGNGIYRNLVNLVDKNVPTTWTAEEGKFKNIKWVAELGNATYGTPVVLGGRVFIGTNNGKPRDPKSKGPKAVLMCFAEKDGAFLWQNMHDMPEEKIIREALSVGLCSTPTAEGDLVYYCTPGAEVICAQAKDGKIVWRFDMIKELKVFPCYLCTCSPLVVGDTVYVITGNGTDEEKKTVAPEAPSFVALAKETGKLVWQSNLPGKNIIQGQWSNPVYAEVKGKPQIIFAGGDGFLYGLEPATGNLIWKFLCSPTSTKADGGSRQYVLGTPVVDGGRVYVAVGGAPESSDRLAKSGHFFCIDIAKTGDVSCKNDDFDTKDPVNKDSALIWHFGGRIQPPPPKRGREERIGPSMSTAAVHDGLVWIGEIPGFLHCLDANTGERYWFHDFKDKVAGSAYWVDGRIFILSYNAECHIFEHGKKYQPPRTNDMDEGGLEGTPVVANGVLYVATPTKLFAIGAK